ncbi:MAG TPA: GIY-YIG nuclease family protein [Alphaproteobacteria bacterium]|jgi:putative endonuclease|nr:GIY-YIG nuclease family protein [Alphaproteobacteria bacterium]
MVDETYYLYILFSTLKIKTYVGITDNPERRLQEHNNGKSYFTNRYKPWVLIYLEVFKNKLEASKREKFLKSRSGRRWMKGIFKEL